MGNRYGQQRSFHVFYPKSISPALLKPYHCVPSYFWFVAGETYPLGDSRARQSMMSKLIFSRNSKLSNEQLAQLQRDTHFDKKELQQWYKGQELQRSVNRAKC